ncbi:MAG: class I SAM-dependent methyltransferase [Phycisphaerae bacterium]
MTQDAPARSHRQMYEASTQKIYDVQSYIYDATFGRLVSRRIKTALQHLPLEKDDRVLDIGIGTGTSLNYYPTDCGKVVGVDLSAGMLREARKKVVETGRGNAAIVRADAMVLPFETDSFDHVFISHVITVVSDPFKLVREAQRVAREGARIVILNHFKSDNRMVGLVEGWLCPLCTKLGWRSDLALSEVVEKTGIEVDYRFKLRTLDLWETVVTTNTKSAVRRQAYESEPAAEGQLDVATA